VAGGWWLVVGGWWLVERYWRMGYDAHRICERYDEHLEDVLVNVFYVLAAGAGRRPARSPRVLPPGGRPPPGRARVRFARLLIDLLAQCGFDAGQPSAARRMMQR
jgi:hypothetical protein